MRKKIGWLFFGLWVFGWTAFGVSIGASEPPITVDNIDQVAQNAPAMMMEAAGCGILGLAGGLLILWECGIFTGKNSN